MKEDATTLDFPEADQIFPSRHLIGTMRLAFVPERLTVSRQKSMAYHRWQQPAFHAMSRNQRFKNFHKVGSLVRTRSSPPTNPSSGIPSRRMFLGQSAKQRTVRTSKH